MRDSERRLPVRLFSNPLSRPIFEIAYFCGAVFALVQANPCREAPENRPMNAMNLWIWLPVLFACGVAVMGALFAFVLGCEKV